jgi:hypothetical protein
LAWVCPVAGLGLPDVCSVAVEEGVHVPVEEVVVAYGAGAVEPVVGDDRRYELIEGDDRFPELGEALRVRRFDVEPDLAYQRAASLKLEEAGRVEAVAVRLVFIGAIWIVRIGPEAGGRRCGESAYARQDRREDGIRLVQAQTSFGVVVLGWCDDMHVRPADTIRSTVGLARSISGA